MILVMLAEPKEPGTSRKGSGLTPKRKWGWMGWVMAQDTNDISYASGSQRASDVTQGKRMKPKKKVVSDGVGERPGGTRLSFLHPTPDGQDARDPQRVEDA